MYVHGIEFIIPFWSNISIWNSAIIFERACEANDMYCAETNDGREVKSGMKSTPRGYKRLKFDELSYFTNMCSGDPCVCGDNNSAIKCQLFPNQSMCILIATSIFVVHFWKFKMLTVNRRILKQNC